MTGLIYLIINHYNVTHNIQPCFYIGSKKDSTKFDEYWSSSKYLLEDIERLGSSNFSKHILETVEYSTTEELLNIEASYQRNFNVKESNYFYNKSYATGPFFSDDGLHIKDTTWVNNGINNKRIKRADLAQYLSNGYVEGRLGGDYNKSRIYINDGIKTKSVTTEQLSSYLSKGWVQGRLAGNQSNKRWVHKGSARKLIPTDQHEHFIADGWKDGWAYD